MNHSINDADFEDALDRHGADPARWPEPLRAQLSAWLDTSPSAQASFAEARRLEEELAATFATVPVPLGLKTRILARVSPREPWLDWLTKQIWRPVGLACVPLALGFALGMGVADDTGDLEDSVLVAFSDPTDFVDTDLLADTDMTGDEL